MDWYKYSQKIQKECSLKGIMKGFIPTSLAGILLLLGINASSLRGKSKPEIKQQIYEVAKEKGISDQNIDRMIEAVNDDFLPARSTEPTIIKPQRIIPKNIAKEHPKQNIYIVQSGDLLSTIARDKLGDPKKWIEIAKLNPKIDPNHISVGQKIILPNNAKNISAPKPVPKKEVHKETKPRTTRTTGKINTTNVSGLDQKFAPKVIDVLTELTEQGWQPRVAEGRRTAEQQREKVRTGRSKTMNSAHLRGFGADIIDSRYGWGGQASDLNFQFWKDLGKAAKKQGLIWGGDWKSFPDVAHIEYPGWKNNK